MASEPREVNLDSGLARAKEAVMNPYRVEPADCQTMAEVRHGVDQLDAQIVSLFAERFRYMDAAARIKSSRDSVRDENRKNEVLANVRRIAASQGADAAVLVRLYDDLIEASIAYELVRYDEKSAA